MNIQKLMGIGVLAMIGLGWTGLPAQEKRPWPPRPRPLPQPIVYAELEVRELDVRVEVQDLVAETQVQQVYFNPGGDLAEATILFPLPPDTQVQSFTLMIDGRETPAELLDAEKAAQIYNEIVRRRKDPGLLEFLGGGLIKARIFPIEARSTRQVKLTYRQLLDSDGKLKYYRFPLRSAQFGASSLQRFAFEANIGTNDPIKTLYCPTHELTIERPAKDRARMSMNQENVRPDRDLEFFFSTSREPLAIDLLTHRDDHGSYFLINLSPEVSREAREIAAKDLVLVVDTSGSMAGQKMDQAKRALRFCIDSLRDGDRFAIIRFSTEAEPVSPGLLLADGENRRRAHQFIDDLEAMGGTNLDEALSLALALPAERGRPQAIVLMTDGKPTIGERSEGVLVERVKNTDLDAKRIFPVGIGTQINTHLLDKLAESARGWRTYVDPDEDLELKISSLYEKIEAPVLSNLNLDVKGVHILETHPKTLPDLFKGNSLRIFGRFKGSGQATITLEGWVAGKKQTFTQIGNFDKGQAAFGFIPQLWAQRRVGYLLDQIRLHGESQEVREEVVRLARRYGIVTPYTSLLILEDEANQRTAMGASAPAKPHVAEEFELKRDRKARRAMNEKSGAESVSASKRIQSMTAADRVSANEPAENEPGRADMQRKMACGRVFTLDDGVWVDSDLHETDKLPKRTLTFADEAYFKMVAQDPELKEIFGLGTRVRFLFKGTIYEIAP